MSRGSDQLCCNAPSKSEASKIFLTANQVRRRYGGITSMTLYRWLKRKKMRFPKPIYINRLRYWELAKLEAWERVNKADDPFVDGEDDLTDEPATSDFFDDR